MIATRLCILTLLILTAGCAKSGPDVATVKGRITLDGQPLKSADVVFQPDDQQRPGIGFTDDDGRYELSYKRGVPGARVGPNTVRISFNPNIVKNPPNVPERYNKNSELRAEVKSGNNEFNFDLKQNP